VSHFGYGGSIITLHLQMSKKQKNESTREWLKRIGWAGILFFTIKGIITTYLLLQAGKCALD